MTTSHPSLHTHATSFQPPRTRQGSQAYDDPTVYVTDFGADPTGQQDSTQVRALNIQPLFVHYASQCVFCSLNAACYHVFTQAFQAAVAELLTRGSGHFLANDIADLGGAILDLSGGDYLISAPIVIPVNYGNFHITGGPFMTSLIIIMTSLTTSGTVRASPSFDPTQYLIVIGDEGCGGAQGACSENVGVSEIMLDCQQHCAGGLLIASVMGLPIHQSLIMT